LTEGLSVQIAETQGQS